MAATESGPAAVGGVSATSAPLIVWDFDWSLVNENSDTFVIRELEGRDGPVWRSNVGQWDRTGGWTALMDRCVKDLWAAGSHKTQFTECLGKIPILSGADKVRMSCIPRNPRCHYNLSIAVTHNYTRMSFSTSVGISHALGSQTCPCSRRRATHPERRKRVLH